MGIQEVEIGQCDGELNGDFTTCITFLRLVELHQGSSNTPRGRLTVYHLPQLVVLLGAEFVGAGIASVSTVGARDVVRWTGGIIATSLVKICNRLRKMN